MLGFLKFSCSRHPLIAGKEPRALVRRLRAMPAACVGYRRICRSSVSYQPFRTFHLVHVHFSTVLSLVPKSRSMWESGGSGRLFPSPLLDRAQIPRCRAVRSRSGRKGSGRRSRLERERFTCRVPSRDESG